MDSTLLAGLVGAMATVVAAVLSSVLTSRRRQSKGNFRGSIEDLVVPLLALPSGQSFKEMLPRAKRVKMCGWTLHRTVDECRHDLRDSVQRGCELRILVLDPRSDTLKNLDSVLTEIDPVERKARNWPAIKASEVARGHLNRVISILRENGMTAPGREIVRLCNSLLPIGLLMVECSNGESWACIQIYPLHPDTRLARRLSFTLRDNGSELWRIIEEQFDAAWEDPSFSYPLGEDGALRTATKGTEP